MPVTPLDDKNSIKVILSKDPYLKSIGYVQKNIFTTKQGTESLNSTSDSLRIFISNGMPRNPRNNIQKGVSYRVTVTGKRATCSQKVDNATTQIIALLTDSYVGNYHLLQLLDPPMEMESDPSLYVLETTFICYETIFNKPRTV